MPQPLTKTSSHENLGNKFNDSTIQTKSYWTIRKSFYNNKKIPLIPPPLIKEKFVKDTNTKANIFKKKKTIMKNNSVLPTSQHVLTQSRLQSIDFGLGDISKIITSVDVNKAHVHDDISIRMITICEKSLIRPLSLLFEKSFDKSYFPEL